MVDNDFMFDDDDEIDESSYFEPVTGTSDSDEEDEESSSSKSDDIGNTGTTDTSVYKNNKVLSPKETVLIAKYDVIAAIKPGDNLELAVSTAIECIPVHTSSTTVNNVLKEMFHTQGHSRRQNSVYDAQVLTSKDFFADDDDDVINNQFYEEYRKLISRFFEYLANRDLSYDDAVSIRNKQCDIPAFIILLFSSNQYAYLQNCETLPKVYQDQVNLAFREIHRTREDLVKKLADAYDAKGRPVIAQKVREHGVSFFKKEPAEVLNTSEFKAAGINADDIEVYREYRQIWNNTCRNITQEFISDYIEVIIDEKKGESRKLRDKTRKKAMDRVKMLFEEWAKDQDQTEFAKSVIFK